MSKITKLKTKSNKKRETFEYKIDTGSDGSLIPIRMYKMLFPHTNITELNKFIEKNTTVHI